MQHTLKLKKKQIKYFLIFFIILIAYTSKAQLNTYAKDNTSYYYLEISDNKNSLQLNPNIKTPFLLNSNIYKNTDITSIYYLQINKTKYTNYSKNIKISRTSKNLLGSKNNIKIFKNKEKKKKTKFQLKIFNDWLIFVIIFSLILLAFVNFYHKKYITKIFTSFSNYRAALKLKEDSNTLTGRSGNILLLLFFINISVLIYELFEYFSLNIKINAILSFLLIFAIVASIFFIKQIIIRLLGSVFEITEIITDYIFNTKIYNQISGIVILPLIISIPYISQNISEILIILSFITLITIYTTRVYRTTQIFFHKQFSILYLFLYFCSIEILPLLILIKLFFLNTYLK